ncbi:MAG TPA: hypothetical protein VIQ74_06470, partial [Gemmatimonadaceae bacterium]
MPRAVGGGTLVEFLQRARARVLATSRPVLATYVEPLPDLDPLDAFARADGGMEDRVYWARPNKGVAVAGVGAAVTVSPSGAGRFVTAGRMWRALIAGGLCDGPGAINAAGAAPAAMGTDAFGRRPMLLGGFRFDPARPADQAWRGYPDAWLAVPRLCLAVSPAGRWLASSVLVRPGDDAARLAGSLERDRDRLLGVGAVSESARAWALIEGSFHQSSASPDDSAPEKSGDPMAPPRDDTERAAREAFLAVV